jgi:hypothetical protein
MEWRQRLEGGGHGKGGRGNRGCGLDMEELMLPDKVVRGRLEVRLGIKSVWVCARELRGI